MTKLFNEDYEVEIEKDSTNFIRGIFSSSAAIPSGPAGGTYRSDDLKITGTISTGDTVKIKGHKSFIAKTDTILPVNLGFSHGSL